jgi:hypothetical protein
VTEKSSMSERAREEEREEEGEKKCWREREDRKLFKFNHFRFDYFF